MPSSHFKLLYLKIENFKNIKNLEIDFEKKEGITVLIGNNGCGKSNILEALSAIFASLYQEKLCKIQFVYHIKYDVNGCSINIEKTTTKYVLKVNEKRVFKSEFKKHREYLPKNVIACYSGESLRLWGNYYWPYYYSYISALKNASTIPELPMIYINRYNIEIALLTLFFYDFSVYHDIQNFCNNTLKITTIQRILFHLNPTKIKEWTDNPVLQMVKVLVDEKGNDIPSKIELSLNEFKNKLSYLTEGDLFKFLYAATMPKDDKIIVQIDLELVLNNGDVINGIDLSEGEKKHLLLKTILESIASENSLLLFDEPDAHIHLCRKAELKELFDKYTNRENIITTHSPTLAVKFEKNHIEGLTLDIDGHTAKIDGEKAKLVAELTDNMWNIHEQNIFLSSNKPITLLVEGKTDKTHIEEAFRHLKASYPNLNFDVFAMNGSEHIREVLIGLSCSEIQWNKKFIGVFDNDQAGQKDITNGFEKENNNNFIKHVKYSRNASSKAFFAFLLPKPENFKESFTIENCYDASKYEDAYNTAVKQKTGHFEGLSIDSIADDLKNKSKIILADNCKNFQDGDFSYFKQIFDLIKNISEI